jgi:hypothetical protein
MPTGNQTSVNMRCSMFMYKSCDAKMLPNHQCVRARILLIRNVMSIEISEPVVGVFILVAISGFERVI